MATATLFIFKVCEVGIIYDNTVHLHDSYRLFMLKTSDLQEGTPAYHQFSSDIVHNYLLFSDSCVLCWELPSEIEISD